MSIESLLFDCTQCESWRSAVSYSLVFLLCPLMGISRSELSHSWTRADLMLCFLIFLCFSKCLHISIYFCSSITLLVLFSQAVFFFLGWLLFYCMPPTTSCLSEEQKQWDCMSQSLCGLHHDWLFYCLAALASIHAQLNPPTVLCSASIHYKQQRLPCAALFIKAWRWLAFRHHCCMISVHISVHETVIVWLCVCVCETWTNLQDCKPAKRCLLLLSFICLSRSKNVAVAQIYPDWSEVRWHQSVHFLILHLKRHYAAEEI